MITSRPDRRRGAAGDTLPPAPVLAAGPATACRYADRRHVTLTLAAVGLLAALPRRARAAELQDSAPAVLSLRADPSERMAVAVLIDGRGPFDFVVDTGAESTVLSDALAAQLGLEPARAVLLHAVGGSALTSTAKVGALRAGEASLETAELPVLPRDRLGADGLLGMDALKERNLVIDFEARRLEVRKSVTRFRANPQEIAVVADARRGRLTIADARLDGVRTAAFIDSGSALSMGNLALGAAVRRKSLNRPLQGGPVEIIGLTDDSITGDLRLVPTLQLGAVTVSQIPLVFSDVHIFSILRLDKRPAMILGSDVLRLFRRVELDFGRGQVRFLLGGEPPERARRVAAGFN